MVRSYLYREEPPREVGRRLGPCPVAHQLTLTPRSPHLLTNHITKRGSNYMKGGQGGRVVSLSFSPSSEDPDLEGCPPPPFHHLSGSAPVSLSYFGHVFLIGGALRLLPYCLLNQVGISLLTTTTPRTLRKATSTMKR
jgi:hypothetical protein